MSTDATNETQQTPRLADADSDVLLRYITSGHPMKAEPVSATLSSVAALLDAGSTVLVSLEPGDGTRYDALLVPLWTNGINARALGYDPRDCRDTLFVFNMQGAPDALRGAVVQRGGVYSGLVDGGAWHMPWSATLLEWWFEKHLWPRLVAIRGVGAYA